MVNVLESTLEWKKGEFIVNSGIGSHTPCFSFDAASVIHIVGHRFTFGNLKEAGFNGRRKRKLWGGTTKRCVCRGTNIACTNPEKRSKQKECLAVERAGGGQRVSA
jgi:hypothetical protein